MVELTDLYARVPGSGVRSAKSAWYEVNEAEEGEICNCEHLASPYISHFDILDLLMDR